MRIIRATAGYIDYSVDGPPRWMVADVHGGEAVILMVDNPEDTLTEMVTTARRIKARRKRLATKGEAR